MMPEIKPGETDMDLEEKNHVGIHLATGSELRLLRDILGKKDTASHWGGLDRVVIFCGYAKNTSGSINNRMVGGPFNKKLQNTNYKQIPNYNVQNYKKINKKFLRGSRGQFLQKAPPWPPEAKRYL